MSGHSKWHSIKHKKAAADSKRGKIFTKIIRELTVAARTGGPDPETNPRLRLAINNARSANMPKDNIERAIKKGSGADDGDNFEEITYEGYCPYGVAVMVEALTDNKNRTVAEVRSILTKAGGNLGSSGSVAYMFERKGMLQIEKDKISEEELFELVTEAGAEDLQVEEEGYTVYTTMQDFEPVRKAVEEHGIETSFSNLVMVPQNFIPVDEASYQKVEDIIEKLEDCDDVQNVYANHELKE